MLMMIFKVVAVVMIGIAGFNLCHAFISIDDIKRKLMNRK